MSNKKDASILNNIQVFLSGDSEKFRIYYHPEKDALKKGWFYFGENRAALIVDYLNENYRALAGGNQIVDEEMVPDRIEYLKKLLPEKLKQGIKDLVDFVFVEQNNLSCIEKYFAYTLSHKGSKDMFSLLFDSYREPYYRIDGKDDFERAGQMGGDEILECISSDKTTPAERKQKFKLACGLLNKNPSLIKSVMSPLLSFYTADDLIAFFICDLIEKNYIIKKCENCGKYFIPTNRTDAVYCNNQSPQDHSKTCKEYAPYAKFLKKSQNDPVYKLYKRVYNKKRNAAKRCSSAPIQRDFVEFNNSVRTWKIQIKSGEKTEQQYSDWLSLINKGRV